MQISGSCVCGAKLTSAQGTLHQVQMPVCYMQKHTYTCVPARTEFPINAKPAIKVKKIRQIKCLKDTTICRPKKEVMIGKYETQETDYFSCLESTVH